MRISAPIICPLEPGSQRLGVAVAEFAVPEVTSAEAPVCCVQKSFNQEVVRRNREDRWYRDLGANAANRLPQFNRTAALTDADIAYVRDHLRWSHSLVAPISDWAEEVSRRPLSRSAPSQEAMRASPHYRAVASRAERLILVDGAPAIADIGPDLRLNDNELGWTIESETTLSPWRRIHSLAHDEREIAEEIAQALGLGALVMNPDFQPVLTGPQPGRRFDRASAALEAMSWMVLGYSRIRRLTDISPDNVETILALRKALLARGERRLGENTGSYLTEWIGDKDLIEIEPAHELIPLLQPFLDEKSLDTPNHGKRMIRQVLAYAARALPRFDPADEAALDLDLAGVAP